MAYDGRDTTPPIPRPLRGDASLFSSIHERDNTTQVPIESLVAIECVSEGEVKFQDELSSRFSPMMRHAPAPPLPDAYDF